jgi:DNA-binding NarL/FixJ family response regulator
VLIAEDQGIVREALVRMIAGEDGFEVVERARDGQEAVAKAIRLRPDVVLMDIGMQRCNGIEAARAIHSQCPSVRVLAFTMYTDAQVVRRMLQAGASGYLTKDTPPDALFEAIRQVCAGETVLAESLRREAAPATGTEAALDAMTPREREVLQCLSEGLSTAEVARELRISPHTVSRHRQQIMNKLGLRGIASLTRFAIEQRLTPLDGSVGEPSCGETPGIGDS